MVKINAMVFATLLCGFCSPAASEPMDHAHSHQQGRRDGEIIGLSLGEIGGALDLKSFVNTHQKIDLAIIEVASDPDVDSRPSKGQVVDSRKNSRNAVGISYGMFSSGFWAPFQPKAGISDWEYDSCNAFFFCSEDGLFGGQINIDYIRRLLDTGRHALDLDVSLGIGWQSPVLVWSESLGRNYVENVDNGRRKFFGLISLMPVYRYRVFEWLSFGFGGGLGYAAGGIPADTQGQDLNATSKFELAIKPMKNAPVEMTFAFAHRCAFFGVLNESGENTGSNWYSLGVRKWF